jgi:hypothetical protein
LSDGENDVTRLGWVSRHDDVGRKAIAAYD